MQSLNTKLTLILIGDCLMLAGPAPCFLISAVVKGGKAQKNGKKGFLGAIRHENALKDCHAAMGRWFVRRYTIEQVMPVGCQQCSADYLELFVLPSICAKWLHETVALHCQNF